MRNMFSLVLKTFKGEVQLREEKELTCNKPIQDFMDPKGDMVFPMQQHIGKPCEPVVKVGERVLRDQIIGKPDGDLGAYIYSSVSGRVKDIKPMPHPDGTMVTSVIIENDHQYETKEKEFQPCSYKELTVDEILKRIEMAGIVGIDGAGFPAHVKLQPPADAKIEYVLINALESEPYLTSDYRVMLEDSWRVVNGLRILLALFPEAKGRIVMEASKPNAIKALQKYIQDEKDIEMTVLKTYPQGDGEQLLQAVTGRTIPADKLASDVGCIVLDVDTAVAISRAITQARPLQRRIVTVAGNCVKNPGNYRVRIGTSFQELLEAAGGLVEKPAKMLCGDPVPGHEVNSLDMPVIKTSSCLLLLSEKEINRQEEPGPTIQNNKLETASEAPFIHASQSPASIMQEMIFSMIPILIFSSLYFGFRALLLTVITVVSAVAAEYIWQKVTKRKITISDCSAAVTGMLLAFCLPANLPFWMAILGAVFSIIVVKQLFGGIGKNIFNPALAGRCFLLILFSSAMMNFQVDGAAVETPLMYLQSGEVESLPSEISCFLGVVPGCLGETSVVLILLGGIYLIFRKVIDYIIPLSYIGTVFLLSYVLGGNGLYQILAGGLMLGAFYMATDYATSPMTKAGKWIMGIGCGIITVFIRFYSHIPDGFSIAILAMNLLVPLIDRLTKQKTVELKN